MEQFVRPEERCQQPMESQVGGICGNYATRRLVGVLTCWECADTPRVLRAAIDRLEERLGKS